MAAFILGFGDIDKASLPLVGGKGANLGELARISAIAVPSGFCVTTAAFSEVVARTEKMAEFYERLDAVAADDLGVIQSLGAEIREYIEGLSIPSRVESSIVAAWEGTGVEAAYAVRSSATAEDLPGASFAGQQDTYLNIIGQAALLTHIRKCWASLFTDRAIIYRAKNGFDHRKVLLAVVVQQMVFPEVAGIMFTADPVNGNRRIVSIDAGFGLGEALVSGLVNADLYKVRGGHILTKQVPEKKLAIYPLPDGGTEQRSIPIEQQRRQALSDPQILGLTELGRRIEAHFGSPQDIEWCLVDRRFYIVQSRPITTLYPMPALPDDRFRILMSFGHKQMMTDPIRPLGMSIWDGISQMGFVKAGGRFYYDVTNTVATRLGRKIFPSLVGKGDELAGAALGELVKRPEVIAALKPEKIKHRSTEFLTKKQMLALLKGSARGVLVDEPAMLTKLFEQIDEHVEQARRELGDLSGPDRLHYIVANFDEVIEMLQGRQLSPVMTGMIAAGLVRWLSKRWLGDEDQVDDLGKSVPGNVSVEMGLEIGDLADRIRRFPKVIGYLRHARDETFLAGFDEVEGGDIVRPAFEYFLRKYGMRCPGEIDITRPRWHERPTQLVPALLSHIRSGAPGAHRARFREGEEAARRAEAVLVARLKSKAGADVKIRIMTRLIKVQRDLTGFREYPKFAIIRHFGVYRQAIMAEAKFLVARGVLDAVEDVYYLSLAELEQVMREGRADRGLIAARREKYALYEKLIPPHMLTSEGEAVAAVYQRKDMPRGALPGIAVSAGVVEGRARVVTKLEDANIDKGDILVAPFTDPGWTPLFVSINALVTEVGGMMTHGAVVAREYGLPAVVGVEGATKLIKDGQLIRVNGDGGYVEIIGDDGTNSCV